MFKKNVHRTAFKMQKDTKGIYIIVLLLCGFTSMRAATISDVVSSSDLIWNSVDGDFYKGAFIGDGIQGAMIMQDTINKNDIRMLLGHYKAIAHKYIGGLDMVNTRVFAGNIIIHPVGKTSKRSMRLDIWDGEANGIITTDKGLITWNAFAERKNNVFVTVIKGSGDEENALLNVREEWGITPSIYQNKKNPNDYLSQLPPKPQLSTDGPINLVINKMKDKGAHVIASRLITGSDKTKILYVAIGTDDNSNIDNAVTAAKNNAILRVNAAVTEGITSITTCHQEWWHNYMQNSFLEIKEDSYWQKFWWLQLYKFASASSETSDLVFDTQGPWIWNCGWAGIWWNLNVQLSYYPMYSSNQLAAGKSLINGMNRIYKSGILQKNAGGSPGITVGRSSAYDGSSGWGDEFGNISWILHSYWKYWKYSGDDSFGKSLFPMLKDNAAFLTSKLDKDSGGKYHFKPSRSPEYTESLYVDANYAHMSYRWVLQTLLTMNTELGFNDNQKDIWQEKLNNLIPYPADQNGLRIGSQQGFDKGHRHYSHLLAIYPFHTLTPDQGTSEKDLISRSVTSWLSFSVGYAGYSYTGGCSMYAILGDGEKAISTLDKLKTKLHFNTMYSEGGGPVIETPLSGVESINYMLIQSWGGKLRLFPAVPSRWKNISFRQFRTEDAFLVSASMSNGVINNRVIIKSEKGKKLSVVNPWKGMEMYAYDNENKPVSTSKSGDVYTFSTIAGRTYTLSTHRQ